MHLDASAICCSGALLEVLNISCSCPVRASVQTFASECFRLVEGET
jgi:hypothetical protein